MKTKYCHQCACTKPTSQFYKNRSKCDGLSTECRTCAAENNHSERRLSSLRKKRACLSDEKKQEISEKKKEYRRKHREEIRAYNSFWIKTTRTKFLKMYGGHCALCGPANPDAWEYEFLTLDHVDGGGARERKESGNATYLAYQNAVKTGIPDFSKYRILCQNHNQAEGHPLKPFDEITPTAQRQRLLRDKVIDGYGAKCSCCGCADRLFLHLDHVNGGGSKHTKRGTRRAHYRDALKRGFPSDYQVLCGNCNSSKHFGGGVCVHQRGVTDQMMKDRASTALGGAPKHQPKKGVSGKRKPHAIHSRKVGNGFVSENIHKDGENEEHVHSNLEDLLAHMKNHYSEEMDEAEGGEELPEGESGKPVSADADEEMKKKLAGEM